MKNRAVKHTPKRKVVTKTQLRPPADEVLYDVVENLERRDRSPLADLDVISALVSRGPFQTSTGNTQAVQTYLERPGENTALCHQLRDFLRAGVRGDQSGQFEGRLSTAIAGAITFSMLNDRGRTDVAVSGHVRDLAVLQLLLLIDRVGLRRVRPCPAPGCDRIFVKRHKTKFCSPTCQRRDEVTRRRVRERLAEEAFREAAARRKRLHAVRGA